MEPAATSGNIFRQLAGGLPWPEELGRHVFIGIDGVDGAGKTMFADELAVALSKRHGSDSVKVSPVVRVSLDGFHRIRRERYRQGRDSPEGFWQDSYDYEAFRRLVVEPLSPGGSGIYRAASHDLATDALLGGPELAISVPSVILIDGIFLHRPELVQIWDASVFLQVSFTTSFQRMAERDGSDPLPEAAANQRYLQGQLLYLAKCAPFFRATAAVDNNDYAAPSILRPGWIVQPPGGQQVPFNP